jgi:cytochrome c oxidase assembly protein subunit 11
MDKNTKTLLSIFAVVIFMVGLAFASVPLYDLFCRVTGFGGTTQVSDSAPDESEILDRQITIHFNSDTNRNLNWSFKPEMRKQTLNVGQQGLINFIAQNKDSQPTVGTAVYNVTPAKAGEYFHKTQCFCFDAQMLTPGEEMNMPVVFYVDPAIANDRNMDDVKTITLSYSFFASDSKELDQALEAFYNAE